MISQTWVGAGGDFSTSRQGSSPIRSRMCELRSSDVEIGQLATTSQ
jgi:hypothetical protein